MNNTFLWTSLILLGMGGLMALLRKVPGQLWRTIERRIIVSLDIQDDDEAYNWMKVWLAGRSHKLRHLSVFTSKSQAKESQWSTDNRPRFVFMPAPGNHLFWFRGRLVFVNRHRKDDEAKAGVIGLGGKRESFLVRILSRDRKLGELLIEEAREAALPDDGKIDVRIARVRWSGSWQLLDRVRPRDIESVILDGNQHLKILDDIKDFQKSHDWYIGLGIPYRRGYLLYGPPGNGKTSLALAIASSLRMNVYILQLSAAGMNDQVLSELMSSVASNSIILMEDVDCAFVQREAGADKKDDAYLTFSGLLNTLDGVGAREGRIILMTTNHREKLDLALIRPGRIDVQVYVGNSTSEQAEKLFARFYEDSPHKLAQSFGRGIPPGEVSVASIQGHLMRYKHSPEEALEQLNELVGNR